MASGRSKRTALPMISTREKTPRLQLDEDDIIEFTPLQSIYAALSPSTNSDDDEVLPAKDGPSKITKPRVGKQKQVPTLQVYPPQSQRTSDQISTPLETSNIQSQPTGMQPSSLSPLIPEPRTQHTVILNDVTNHSANLSSIPMDNLNSTPVAANGQPPRQRGRRPRQTIGARPPSPSTTGTNQNKVFAMVRQKSHQACQSLPLLIDACMYRIEASRMLEKSKHDFNGRATEYLDAQTPITFQKTIAGQESALGQFSQDIESFKTTLQDAMADAMSVSLRTQDLLAAKTEESLGQMAHRLWPSEQALRQLAAENQVLAQRVQELTTACARDAVDNKESYEHIYTRLGLSEHTTGERTKENQALAEKVQELTTACTREAAKAEESYKQTSARLGLLEQAMGQVTTKNQVLVDQVQELTTARGHNETRIKELENDRDAMLKRLRKAEEDMAAMHKTLEVQKKVLNDLISQQKPSHAVLSDDFKVLLHEQAEPKPLSKAAIAEHARLESLIDELKGTHKVTAKAAILQHEHFKKIVVDQCVELELKIDSVEVGCIKIQDRIVLLEIGGVEIKERHSHLEADTKAMQSQLTGLDRELRPATHHGEGSAPSRVINRIANLEDGVQDLTLEISRVIKLRRNYDILDKEFKRISSITSGLLATTRKLEVTHRPQENDGDAMQKGTGSQAQKLVNELRRQIDARLHKLETADNSVRIKSFDNVSGKRDALEERVDEMGKTMQRCLEALETVDVSTRDQQICNLQVNVNILHHAVRELETGFNSLDQIPSSGNAEAVVTVRPNQEGRLGDMETLLNKHDSELRELTSIITACDVVCISRETMNHETRLVALEKKVFKAAGSRPKQNLDGSHHMTQDEKTKMGSDNLSSSSPKLGHSPDTLANLGRLALKQPGGEETLADERSSRND